MMSFQRAGWGQEQVSAFASESDQGDFGARDIGLRQHQFDRTLGLGEASGGCGATGIYREDGDAPAVNLEAEKRNGDFIRDNRAWIDCCVDRQT